MHIIILSYFIILKGLLKNKLQGMLIKDDKNQKILVMIGLTVGIIRHLLKKYQKYYHKNFHCIVMNAYEIC